MVQTIAITLSYDGSGFAGFARQPGQRTVQGAVEDALATIMRQPVDTVGAGRTDAGVHALGQVMSFSIDTEFNARSLIRSLNAIAGPGIVVTEAREVRHGFSARFDAISREYRYRIVPGVVAPAFLAGFGWWVKTPMDLAAMREAAAMLIGEHDFRSFCVADSAAGKSTIRALELMTVEPAVELGEHCIIVRIVGNAFLHSMVRILIGSLVEVGVGKRDPVWIEDALAAQERCAAGVTAPAHGLTLWHVNYPTEYWL